MSPLAKNCGISCKTAGRSETLPLSSTARQYAANCLCIGGIWAMLTSRLHLPQGFFWEP